MKDRKLFRIIFLTVFVCGTLYVAEGKDYSPFPNPAVGYVTDIAGVLTPEQIDTIQGWLYTTEKRTGVEIAVVTINSIKDYPGTPNNSIEEFATGLFNAYGIGNIPKNNGVLLLIAIKDRKARIELGARYGHNKDWDAQKIMDKNILPYFRNNQYGIGIEEGVRAIMNKFAGLIIIPRWVKICVAAAIPVFVLVALSLFRNGKRGWGWICTGLIFVLLLGLYRLLANAVESLPKGSSAGGYGGGFGGGFSGGGGATGSW